MKIEKTFWCWNFNRDQFHQNFLTMHIFLQLRIFFKFFQKSSVLWMSSKKFLYLKVFEDFSKFRRIFVFGLFSKSEDSSSSSSVHFQSSLQHWCLTELYLNYQRMIKGFQTYLKEKLHIVIYWINSRNVMKHCTNLQVPMKSWIMSKVTLKNRSDWTHLLLNLNLIKLLWK